MHFYSSLETGEARRGVNFISFFVILNAVKDPTFFFRIH
jgi:hypothetical protein